MLSGSRTQIAAAVLMIACLGASGFLTGEITASAGRNRLLYTDRAEDGDPPQVGLGIAMGAFRGLFVNMLWLRAHRLKEAGKYYEAMDLASSITKLQPRFPRVWAFHAWNMSYNISVATQTAEERWQWVYAGIRLLRDQGIPANPNDLLLHKELAWIFLHKVQGVMDDANNLYKRQHALEWAVTLGAPPARSKETRSTQAAIDAYVRWLQPIADAPDTLAALQQREPATTALIQTLRAAGMDVADPDQRRQILRLVEEERAARRLGREINVRAEAVGQNKAIIDLMYVQSNGPAWLALVPFLRKAELTARFHMEPQRMIRYTRRYGPLDWRHPAAHAIYWSARGVEESLQRVVATNKDDSDFINTDRVTIQAVQELFRSGSVMFDILNPQAYLQLPNPDYIPIYGDILEEVRTREESITTRYNDPRKVYSVAQRVWGFYRAGYENFLKDAICYLYRRGDRGLAEQYRQRLLTWEGLNDNDPAKVEELSRPLDEFVQAELTDRTTTPNVALAEVTASIQGALTEGLLAGDDEMFTRQVQYARAFYDQFIREMTRRNIVDPSSPRVGTFPSFDEFTGKVFTSVVMLMGLQEGAILYKRAPDALKLAAYDELLLSFGFSPAPAPGGEAAAPDAAQNEGMQRFQLWFPEPPGLEAFRARRAAEEAAKRDGLIDVQEK